MFGVCFTLLFFYDFSLEWLFCLWFGCIVNMEMQSRDYYYHFQTYLPTLSSGSLRPCNIKSNRYGLYIIREYGSTLYVGLARAVSPTNTNFRLTFLLTRLQEALYEDLAV